MCTQLIWFSVSHILDAIGNFFVNLEIAEWIALLALIVAVIGIFEARKRDRNKDYKVFWRHIGPAKSFSNIRHLEHHSFNKKINIQRPSRERIKNLVRENKSILIIGNEDEPTKRGKTREAYEAIRSMHDRIVFFPKVCDETYAINIDVAPKYSKRNIKTVIFFENIDKYKENNIAFAIEAIKRLNSLNYNNQTLVIATANRYNERDKNYSLPVELHPVELEKLTPGHIDHRTGKKYTRINKKYNNLSEVALRIFRVTRFYDEIGFHKNKKYIRRVCGDIFKLDFGVLHYKWKLALLELYLKGFIKLKRSHIELNKNVCEFVIYEKDFLEHLNLNKFQIYFKEYENAGGLFYLGNHFSNKEDYVKASDCLQTAISIYPKYASAHYVLGNIFITQYKNEVNSPFEKRFPILEKAIEYLEEAVSLRPDFYTYCISLGYAYTLRGNQFFLKGEFEKSTREYLKAEEKTRVAIGLNYGNSDAPYRGVGYIQFKLKNYDEGKKNLEMAININPRSSNTYNQLGRLLFEEGRSKKDFELIRQSENNYISAIENDPLYFKAQQNLGYLYNHLAFALRNLTPEETGKYLDAATKLFLRAIKNSKGTFLLSYVCLGRVYLTRNWPDKAIASISRAVMRNPSYAKAHEALGYSYLRNSDYENAGRSFLQSMELNIKGRGEYKSFGKVFLKVQDKNRFSDELIKLRIHYSEEVQAIIEEQVRYKELRAFETRIKNKDVTESIETGLKKLIADYQSMHRAHKILGMFYETKAVMSKNIADSRDNFLLAHKHYYYAHLKNRSTPAYIKHFIITTWKIGLTFYEEGKIQIADRYFSKTENRFLSFVENRERFCVGKTYPEIEVERGIYYSRLYKLNAQRHNQDLRTSAERSLMSAKSKLFDQVKNGYKKEDSIQDDLTLIESELKKLA